MKNGTVEDFVEIIKNSDNIVFFGGAGVSTESGIPDFRSVDGLYNMKYDYPPETIISHSFFMSRPEEFYRFYRDKILLSGIEPNTTHKQLAKLEEMGKLKAIVTQNIDGLHQKAGSKTVLEIHGTVALNTCTKCGKKFDGQYMIDAIDNGVPEWEKKNYGSVLEKNERKYHLPLCDKCGGLIKPDVVLYEEGLDDHTWYLSQKYISEADVLIIAGTSLVVYPAAGLVNYYKGNKLVLINLSETPYDDEADLVLHKKLGEVFDGLCDKISK
ncbi:MAG: NAD-dependent protein deacylase [Lachnospiraceae bacterium]|nr:NAD-dependent protein deacylase [Lachnospiraceae bacterium]